MLVLPAVLALLTAVTAGAQQFSFGVKGGVPVTQFLTPGPPNRFAFYTFHADRYVAGVTTELRLTRRLSIGVEALFRHWSYDNGGEYQPGFSFFASQTLVNDLEFPLLARYRLRKDKKVSAFVTAGAAVDWLQHMRQVTVVSPFIGPSSTFSTSQPIELSQRTTAGVVGGGGVDVRLCRLHVEPEVRYTFWTRRHFGEPSPSYYGLFSNRNQVEVLLGIKF